MWRYAALLSYRGGPYCGWQTQIKGVSGELPSVQSTFAEALEKITQERVSIIGSGRTDSGVHAVGQVAHFTLKRKEWSPKTLEKALNWGLPPSIRVARIAPVPLDFHAQKSAVRKQYSYYFQQGACALPHLEPYSWWIRKRLDQAAMREALNHLRGEHDFKPFRASGAKPGSTSVRKILEAEILEERVGFPHGRAEEAYFVRMRLVGTGFLKQMVRGIAGTLLQVGEGRRKPSCMLEILERQDRSLLGQTAPGRALWLERVWYEPDIDLGPRVD